MRKLFLMLSLLALQGVAGAQVRPPIVAVGPSVSVDLGNGLVRNFDGSDGTLRPGPGGKSILWELPGFSVEGVASVGAMTILYDSDPFVSWSVGAATLGASPITFNFSFAIPYVAGPYNTLLAGVAASVSVENGSALSPMSLTGITHDSRVDNAVLLNTGLADCIGQGTALDCGLDTGQTSVAAPAAGLLGSQFQFTLAPRNSTAAAGNSTLIAANVPEPQTYAMLLAGLLLIGAAARRRAA